MAGEIVKSEGICLAIRPWSRTSHVVWWQTPTGRVTTLVKGAVRPKSAFLGQYDLNYRCEILYYARAHGELHALRETTPLDRRDGLRGNYRALVLADYLRRLVTELAPDGPDAADWFALLERTLALLGAEGSVPTGEAALRELLVFELEILDLAGLRPDLADEEGLSRLRGERQMQLSPEVVACLRNPRGEKNPKILLDAERAIGVFYSFHLDCARDVRRAVLRVIS